MNRSPLHTAAVLLTLAVGGVPGIVAVAQDAGRSPAVLVAASSPGAAPASGSAPASAPAPAAAPAGKAGSPGAPRPALVVTTLRPARTDIPDTLIANGSIAAWQEASVGAEVNGLRIAEVRADVGDVVKRGQVLAVFATETVQADVANVQAALAEARAGLGEAQAAAAEAQSNADRARLVEPSGALSAQQVAQYLTAAQTAQARVQSAQARVQSAQAQLQTQQLRMRMTRVVAPDDGVISMRTATVGSVVPAGQELFRLVRKNRLEWRGEVTAAELARIVPQQTVRVQPGTGEPIRGTVRVVGPVLDPQTRNATVYVDLPQGAPARAGMFARGEFEFGTRGALTVPQQAIVVRDGFAYVFRVTGNRVAQLKVKTGRRVGDRIELLEGVTPDTVIVASGAGFLNDGDLVQVVAAAAATPAPAAPAKALAK